MVKPKVLILFAAGTNCEMETQTAFEIVGTKTRLIHINELKKNANLIHKFHIFVIPGGFSYGDYISAGKVLANEIKNSIMEELFNFSRSKKIILGICNGFQVLLKLGLLPYELKHVATLTFNDSGKFECRWVYLKTFKSYITKGMPEVIELPVAHAEGKFVVKSKKILDTL
ncbi:MAG: phosphoribosylformylglycinamidine synthase subunit PurQ, partial [bacterium]|nr:phosphoribosylformylglycinamidine synthase subunit PurQ [bacterium]